MGIKMTFYESQEWLSIRVRVLQMYECKCMMCGRSPKAHGVVIHVDHIKPRSKRPELELDINNLQLLCEDCNIGKSNNYDTDWRADINNADMMSKFSTKEEKAEGLKAFYRKRHLNN